MKKRNSAKSVIEFYVLCNRLKNIIRTGWTVWGVKRERVESIAEHIFSVQQLAIAMWSQYNYKLDIRKVIMMLALHEMEEIIIGDMTQWQISPEEKRQRGHAAIRQILSKLIRGAEIEQLIFEFDNRKTPEAKFAYQCDKLECDLQSKLYDEENCVDLTKQDANPVMADPAVSTLLEWGLSWSEMWLEFGRRHNGYDQNFKDVSMYASLHAIGQKRQR